MLSSGHRSSSLWYVSGLVDLVKHLRGRWQPVRSQPAVLALLPLTSILWSCCSRWHSPAHRAANRWKASTNRCDARFRKRHHPHDAVNRLINLASWSGADAGLESWVTPYIVVVTYVVRCADAINTQVKLWNTDATNGLPGFQKLSELTVQVSTPQCSTTGSGCPCYNGTISLKVRSNLVALCQPYAPVHATAVGHISTAAQCIMKAMQNPNWSRIRMFLLPSELLRQAGAALRLCQCAVCILDPSSSP